MIEWYALYTRPRHEKKAFDLLTQKGEIAYLPLLTAKRNYKTQKKIVALPLFPSYLFCQFEYKNRLSILETHGIIKVVNFNGTPATVPQWQIEAMKTILLNPETLQMENYIRKGDLVEIHSGPFKGLKGTVVERKGKSRLVITIEGIMQTMSVELDEEEIETIKGSTLAV